MQEFDLEKVVAESDSVQEAMKAAAAGTEQSIRSAIDKIQLKFVTELNVVTNSCRSDLDDAHAFREAEPLAYDDELVPRNQRELLAEKRNTEVRLTQEKEGLVSNRQQQFLNLNAFKASNNLVRDAVEAGNPVLHWGIFALLLLGETLINGWFFAQTNERGLLGGAAQAFIFSFINIVLAILCAYWIRYIHHNSLTPQIIGFFGVVTYLVANVLYNCFVGHYRNALEVNLDMEVSGLLINDASIEALKNFKAGPLAVGDVESVTLVLIGFFLSIGALYKTYSHGDVYPRFASTQKRFSVAHAKLIRFRNTREQVELAEVYDDAIENLNLEKTKTSDKLTNFKSSLSMSQSVRDRLEAQIAEAKSSFKAELNKFDLAYQQHSAQTLPPTIVLDDYIENLAPSTIIPEPNLDAHNAKLEEGEPNVMRLLTAISTEVNEKLSEKEQALTDLKSSWAESDQIYLNSAVFLRGVEASANG